MRIREWLGVILLVGLCPNAVSADVVTLDDGSRLVGTVTHMADGKLTIETSFAGEIAIDAGRVSGVTTDRPMVVALEGGDRISGRLEHDGSTQRLTGTTFGDVTIPARRLQAAWAKGEPAPAAAVGDAQSVEELKAKHQQEVDALRDELKAVDTRWTAKVEGGLDGQTGNSEKFGFRARAQAKRTTDVDRFLTYIQGRYAVENSERSTNEVMGGAKLEVDISEKWFTFGRIELEFDEFENLDLRSTATAGMGYFFIQEPDHELKTRLGLGYVHEAFDDGTSDNQAIAEVAVEYMKHINEWLNFTHSTTYLPRFEDLGDYRLVADTAGEIPLNDDKNFKLKIGMRNEYDAMPQPGIDQLDTYYYLNFVYDLIK